MYNYSSRLLLKLLWNTTKLEMGIIILRTCNCPHLYLWFICIYWKTCSNFVAYLEPKLPSCLGGEISRNRMSAPAAILILKNISPMFFFFCLWSPMGINRRKGKKTKQISILGRARVGDNTQHVHQYFFSFFGYQNFSEISPRNRKISQSHTCKT